MWLILYFLNFCCCFCNFVWIFCNVLVELVLFKLVIEFNKWGNFVNKLVILFFLKLIGKKFIFFGVKLIVNDNI